MLARQYGAMLIINAVSAVKGLGKPIIFARLLDLLCPIVNDYFIEKIIDEITYRV